MNGMAITLLSFEVKATTSSKLPTLMRKNTNVIPLAMQKKSKIDYRQRFSII